MSKKTKKRNKPYAGADAAKSQPTVRRYQAVVRSPLGEWWHDNKRRVKIYTYIGGGSLLFVWLMYELIRVVT